MTKFKVLALAATLVLATAGLAIAGGDCDGKAKAETAKAGDCSSAATAETAAAKTASAEGCASKAAAKTASAEGCASKATAETAAVKTAGAGCASKATAQTAGAGCSSKASAQTVKLETVRMPSGAMAVFYHGTDAETVAFLQSKAEAGCGGFVCNMAKSMAADENVTTEIAATDTGVMILVTSQDAEVVDGYEAQYASMTIADAEQGE